MFELHVCTKLNKMLCMRVGVLQLCVDFEIKKTLLLMSLLKTGLQEKRKY